MGNPVAQPEGTNAAPPKAAPPAPAALAPGRLTLIGTGHVFDIQRTVHDAVVTLRPDVVFIELDAGRLNALLERRRTGKDPDVKGARIQKMLQDYQRGIADMYGTQAGAEMLAAFDAARLVGAKVALVDPPVEESLGKLRKALTVREYARIAGMALAMGARALWPFGREQAKAKVEAEIAKYQSDPEAAMRHLQRQFPSIHRVLIEERNAVMAQRIRAGLRGARHGIAVLGDGHVDGIVAILADLRPETFRLEAVRQGRLPKVWTATTMPGQTSKVSLCYLGDSRLTGFF